jgi:hypothetical protein
MLETFKIQAHIGQDGLLKLEIPTRLKQHQVEVVLVLSPMSSAVAQEPWEDFVNRMYGALADDPIERPPQLPLETRDVIE